MNVMRSKEPFIPSSTYPHPHFPHNQSNQAGMKTWLKVELHAHTVDDPVDGHRIVSHSAEKLIDEAARQEFEVLSITNHDQMLFSPQLEEYARERNLLLIPGVEATLEGKHVLLYNFSNYSPSWNQAKVVSKNKGPDQLVIAAHPFFPSRAALGKRLFEWAWLFDGIEYSHFYLFWLNFNRRAEKAALRFNLPLVGNSDVHHLFQLGHTYSLVYAEKTIRSVVEAIKQGNVRLVTQPVNSFFVANWLARAAMARPKLAVRTALSQVPGSRFQVPS